MSAIVIVLAVVLFAVIITFCWQNAKMNSAHEAAAKAEAELARVRSEADFYAKELKSQLTSCPEQELRSLRNATVKHRMDVEERSDARSKGIVDACRRLVDDIDDTMFKKLSSVD